MTDEKPPAIADAEVPADAFDPLFSVVPGSEWDARIGMQATEENSVDGGEHRLKRLPRPRLDPVLAEHGPSLALPAPRCAEPVRDPSLADL